MSKIPKNWPQGVRYIEEPVYHSSLSDEVLASIRRAPASLPVASTPVGRWTRIAKIESPLHPATGQLGLFTTRKVPPNTLLLFYIGEVHSEERDGSDYDISLLKTRDGINVGVDAQFMGNEARCINDYRGVADKPNALFKEVHTSKGELRMSVWTGSKAVLKGEELLVSYGKGFWKARATTQEGC